MSTNLATEHVRFRLAQSIPIVERRRDEILQCLQNRLVVLERPDEPFGQGDVAAMLILDLLIACSSDLAAFGGTGDLRQAAAEHVRLGIGGRHYSRFGMSLAPALREALGLTVSPLIIAAWCDTYWLVIGRITEIDAKLGVDDYLQVIR